MKYLQRFSRALAAMADRGAGERVPRKTRRQVRLEDGDWLGELHLVARSLPPRRRGDSGHPG